jgi:hypothetical protein
MAMTLTIRIGTYHPQQVQLMNYSSSGVAVHLCRCRLSFATITQLLLRGSFECTDEPKSVLDGR